MLELKELAAQIGISVGVLIFVIIWTLVWKGIALWIAASKKQPVWFIILLVVNTMAILEILYIFLFSRIQLDKYAQKKSKVTRRARKR